MVMWVLLMLLGGMSPVMGMDGSPGTPRTPVDRSEWSRQDLLDELEKVGDELGQANQELHVAGQVGLLTSKRLEEEQAKNEKLMAENAKLKKTGADVVEATGLLTEMTDDAQAELARVQRDNQEKAAELELVKARSVELDNKLQDLMKENLRIGAEEGAKLQKISNLTQQLAKEQEDHRNALLRLQNENRRLADENDELSIKIQYAEAEVTKVPAKMKKMHKQRVLEDEDEVRKIKLLDEQREELEAQRAKLATEVAAAQVKQKEFELARKKLEEQVAVLARRKQDVNVLRETLENKLARVAEAQSELNTIRAELSRESTSPPPEDEVPRGGSPAVESLAHDLAMAAKLAPNLSVSTTALEIKPESNIGAAPEPEAPAPVATATTATQSDSLPDETTTLREENQQLQTKVDQLKASLEKACATSSPATPPRVVSPVMLSRSVSPSVTLPPPVAPPVVAPKSRPTLSVTTNIDPITIDSEPQPEPQAKSVTPTLSVAKAQPVIHKSAPVSTQTLSISRTSSSISAEKLAPTSPAISPVRAVALGSLMGASSMVLPYMIYQAIRARKKNRRFWYSLGSALSAIGLGTGAVLAVRQH